MKISKFTTIMLGALMVLGATIPVQADDKKVDPSGTYVWVMPARNGGSDRTNSLALKMEGDTLTGKLASPGRDGKINETVINDAKLTGTNVSFSVVRTYNDNTFTNKYTGAISGSAIKGKIEFVRDGGNPVA